MIIPPLSYCALNLTKTAADFYSGFVCVNKLNVCHILVYKNRYCCLMATNVAHY